MTIKAEQVFKVGNRDEISLSNPKSFTEDCDIVKYTWDDVHNHRAIDDCWMVIDGKVYDFTTWVPKHPGGNLIMNGAGRDATALFISYHSLHVQSMLPKYQIGEIENYSPYYKWQSEFYTTLKRRVEEVQKKHNLRTDSFEMYFKSALLLVLWATSWYYILNSGSLIGAIFFGLCHGQIGIQIAHDGNHGSYSRKSWITKIAAHTMDMVGASALNWNMQHNVGHHPNSNRKGDYYDEDYDPDVRVNTFVRLSPNHPWRPFHRFQHFYIWILISFVAMKWVYGDLRSLYYQKYQSFDYWKISKGMIAWSLFTKIVFFGYTYVPFVYYHGFLHGSILEFLFLAAQSYVYICMFAVNHLTEDTSFPNEVSKERDWAKLQIMTSSNFAVGSKFWLWMSGGLNYQTEHHLFPAICHMYLPYISPVVQQTCKEYGVKYSQFDSYWDAFVSYYKHLRNLGERPEEHVAKKSE